MSDISLRTQKRRRMLRQILTDWQLYLLVLPAVVYIFLFNYMPMYGVQIAFRNFRPSKGIWGSQWVGLQFFHQVHQVSAFFKNRAEHAVDLALRHGHVSALDHTRPDAQ